MAAPRNSIFNLIHMCLGFIVPPYSRTVRDASVRPVKDSKFLETDEMRSCDSDGHLGYAGAPGLLGFFGSVTSDIAQRRWADRAVLPSHPWIRSLGNGLPKAC